MGSGGHVRRHPHLGSPKGQRDGSQQPSHNGPWHHSQVNRSVENLGPLKWKGDTTADFRKDVLIPLFDIRLKDRKAAESTPPVLIYNSSENHWDNFTDWPGVTEQHLTPFYLQSNHGLAFKEASAGEDSYVSDPAKPVLFIKVPLRLDEHAR